MKNGDKRHFDVFISYRRDKGFGIARSIYAELVFRGYRVFMDTEHLGSGEFDVELLERIKKAKDVIFVLTPGALDLRKDRDPGDDWFRLEIDAALSAEKRPNILPIRDSEFKWPSDDVLQAVALKNGQKVKLKNGIDVLNFKKWEAETFTPPGFSHLVDLLSGVDKRKDFSLRSHPVGKYWHRIKTALVAGVLALGLLWGAASQVRSIGKLFGVRHDPVILIGSGTVSNYLRKKGVEKDDPDVLIVDAPSNYALKLLREAKNSERGHCYVMLMAAQFMADDHFGLNTPDASPISVVEVKLPDSDKLQVILKPFAAFSRYVPNDASSIRVDRLAEILASFLPAEDTFVYRTNEQSGTFRLFSNEFAKIGFRLEDLPNVAEFHESDKGTALHMTTDDKVIVLCGALYKPADSEYNCKNLEGKLLDVVDTQGRPIEKPLNLYYVVSKDNPSIPAAINAFLRVIEKSDVLDNVTTSNLNTNGIIYRDND